jgi:hypothetical protein
MNAMSTPELRGSKELPGMKRRSTRSFKIVALILAVAAAFTLAKQSPQQEGTLQAVASPGDVLTGIDYYPAQFASPAATQAPEAHIQAY